MSVISKHLQEQLDKLPKNTWFTKDDVILIHRTDWVLSKLVDAGILTQHFKNGKSKYFLHAKTTKP